MKKTLVWILVALGIMIMGIYIATHLISDHLGEKGETEKDLLEGGRRSRKSAPKTPKAPTLARSTKAADEILAIDLPADDPRVRSGGRRLFVLRGNGVVYRRAPSAIPFQRGLLMRADADALVRGFLDQEKNARSVPGAYGVTIATDEKSVALSLDPEMTDAAFATPLRDQTTWVPKSLLVTVEPFEGSPDDGIERLPWPFLRGTLPACLGGAEVTGAEDVMRRAQTTWTPGTVVVSRFDDEKPARIQAISALIP